ncbi:MAG: F0F1 ATP synthase subunit alpha, partial [Hylemonella sp.]|nr:F0F1 ATP synthase subunit alpha [Hylemonella sp.]
GQRGTAVARVVQDLRRHEVMGQCIVVVAAGEDPPGLQYITPYAAMSMGEYFMTQGRDVLIVFDDLTRHARAYRELSLLLRRPPGREAYPGDIFYIHSRLLERATHLRESLGGGSLTALPIIETQGQNIAAYIPTNLISICDGQLYLSPELVRKAMMPAVDVGRSVSRVGGKTQLPALRAVAGDLRLSYAQFEELESFARFATRMDTATRQVIDRGRRVRELLRQAERQPLRVAEQVVVLMALNAGLFDAIEPDAVQAAERRVRESVLAARPDLGHRLDSGHVLEPDESAQLLEAARQALASPQAAAHGHG